MYPSRTVSLPLRTLLTLGLAGAIALAGCSTASTASPTSTTSSSASPSSEYATAPSPPLPVAAPVHPFDPRTDVADLDGSVVAAVAEGEVRFSTPLGPTSASFEGSAELRAVSASGDRAALLTTDATSSTITVVDSHGGADPSTYRLPGLVEPEAFSTDGSLLFVIDHEISRVDGAYRVRPLDLATGELQTIVGPSKVPLLDDMNGTGRRQVWSPDGSRLNTLYIRQTHHHHDADRPGADHGHGEAGTDGFVHVLDLDDEWAHCLDLPVAFGEGELATTALAVSADGSTLAVADVNAGQIAFASSTELRVERVLPLPDFAVDQELQIGLLPDALVMGSGREVRWFDPQTMEPISPRQQLPHRLAAFTPISDGSTILAWPIGGDSPPTELRP